MDFSGITTKDCLVDTDGCGNPQTPTECEDLEYAADNPTLCPNSSPIASLRVNPTSGEVEVGGQYPFRAYLVFENGLEKDVTDLATWTSLNEAVATVESTGFATGVAVGVSTVKAAYRGKFDFGQLSVVAACTTIGIDFVLVLDRSGSMGPNNREAVGSDGKTRMEKTLEAAKAFIKNVHYDRDQVAVVSFGGVWEQVDAVNWDWYGDTTLHASLTDDEDVVEAALDEVTPDWDSCITTNAEGFQRIACNTGIGSGLQAAYDELKSSRHIEGNSRVVVLLTDGNNNICDVYPSVVAQQMHDELFTVVVISLAIPDDQIANECGGNPSPARITQEFLQSLSTCNYFYVADTADDLPDIYATLPRVICQGYDTGQCGYYYLGS